MSLTFERLLPDACKECPPSRREVCEQDIANMAQTTSFEAIFNPAALLDDSSSNPIRALADEHFSRIDNHGCLASTHEKIKMLLLKMADLSLDQALIPNDISDL